MKSDRDLVIVGCGIAGTSAAVTALQAGLAVTLLERAPEEDFGGNSRWTEAYLRMKNDAEVSDDFEEKFAQNAGANLDPNVLDAVAGEYQHWPPYVKAHALPDPELIEHFAKNVPPTIAWLKSFGLKFAPQAIYLLTQSTTRIAAQGGGLALIERLMQEAKTLGAEVRFRTTAVGLLRDPDGRIAGVQVIDPGRKAPRHPRPRHAARERRRRGQPGNDDPLHGHARGEHPPGGARRLLQQGRGHPHGACRGRGSGGGFRLVPCRAGRSALAPARGGGAHLSLRHPGQQRGLRFVNEGPGMVDAGMTRSRAPWPTNPTASAG